MNGFPVQVPNPHFLEFFKFPSSAFHHASTFRNKKKEVEFNILNPLDGNIFVIKKARP